MYAIFASVDPNLYQAIILLVQGMAGIFVVLGIIAVLVMLLQKLDRRGH